MDDEFATMNEGKQAVSQPATKPIQPQHSTEAPCSANVKANVGGYDWQITCRSHVDQDDLINMARSIKWWNTWLDKESEKATKTISIITPTATATITPTVPQPPAPNGNGTMQIHSVKMTVSPRADGKVDLKWFEAGHQYPDIYTTKTPLEAVTLLKVTGAWAPQHFATAAEYAVAMTVNYKNSEKLNKNGKPYKDILNIEAA